MGCHFLLQCMKMKSESEVTQSCPTLSDRILTRIIWAFPGGASGKEPACQFRRYKRCWFVPWVRKIPWRRDSLPTPVFLGFLVGPASKASACNVGNLGSTPVLGRSPGEVNSYPLQYSGPENSMDCIVHGYIPQRVG